MKNYNREEFTIENLEETDRSLVEWLENKLKNRLSSEDLSKILTVSAELESNLYDHAYPQEQNDDPDLVVLLESNNENLNVTFRDHGKPFNPLKHDFSGEEELSEGGMGIRLVRQISDGIEYQRKNNTINELSLHFTNIL